jgi:hypothetical protein
VSIGLGVALLGHRQLRRGRGRVRSARSAR